MGSLDLPPGAWVGLLLLVTLLLCPSLCPAQKGKEVTPPSKPDDGMPDQCYVCRSFAEGVYYPHCPKNGSVNIAITWRENCTGPCFTRTDDEDPELVYRGCVDSQWGLPNPLPPDGCYTWYLEVWCICTGHLCNYRKLGTPQNVELDAHITKAPIDVSGQSGGNMAAPPALLLLLALPAFFTLALLLRRRRLSSVRVCPCPYI